MLNPPSQANSEQRQKNDQKYENMAHNLCFANNIVEQVMSGKEFLETKQEFLLHTSMFRSIPVTINRLLAEQMRIQKLKVNGKMCYL